MYLFYIILFIIIENSLGDYVKCSSCKHFINNKLIIENDKIKYIPEKCKLFYKLNYYKNFIKKDNVDISTCRSYYNYCGKEGKYYEE
jgi:hypothetical protein